MLTRMPNGPRGEFFFVFSPVFFFLPSFLSSFPSFSLSLFSLFSFLAYTLNGERARSRIRMQRWKKGREKDHLRPRMDTSNGSTVEGGISSRVIGQITERDFVYIR